jgi:hypothetical protein
LPLPCPVSNFPFAARDRRRKLHRERAMFFFPFAARVGGRSYTRNGYLNKVKEGNFRHTVNKRR